MFYRKGDGTIFAFCCTIIVIRVIISGNRLAQNLFTKTQSKQADDGLDLGFCFFLCLLLITIGDSYQYFYYIPLYLNFFNSSLY